MMGMTRRLLRLLDWNMDFSTAAWIAAVRAQGADVSRYTQVQVNNFIMAEKSGLGSWGLTDDYWGLWAESPTQALMSLKQRRLGTTTGSPVFTPNRQYQFNGTSNYIDTGFIPSTHGIAYTGALERLAVYERIDLGASAYAAGTRVGTSSSIAIIPRGSTSMTGLVNNTAGSATFILGVTNSRGLKAVSRAGGTTALGYDRGIRLTDVNGLTIGGAAAPSVSLMIGALNSSGTPISFRAAAVGFVCIGGPLSDAQEASQYANVQAWATALNAQT